MHRLIAVFLALLALFAIEQPAPAAERVALVLGNSDYQHIGLLKNPGNDAGDLAAKLRQVGFEVLLGLDLKSDRLAALIDEFMGKLKGAKVGLLFYAGHGMQMHGVNYILPVDAKLENEFALRRETFSITDLIEAMEARVAMNLVFLDACRDNPLAASLVRRMQASGRSVIQTRGLAPINMSGRDTFVAFATAPGDVAHDGQGRNSPFSEALLKHIDVPGIEIESMLKRVTADVHAATNGLQKPERLSRLTTEFFFKPAVLKPAPEPDRFALPPGPPPPKAWGGPAPTPGRAVEPVTGQDAWAKLCEKTAPKPGEPADSARSICLTFHERLDASSGMVLVSAAVRWVESSDRQHLMLMVPLGGLLAQGTQMRIDDGDPFALRFSMCHAAGCTAEIEATEDVVRRMMTGKEMTAFMLNKDGKPVALPMPLAGFAKAYHGQPLDNAAYAAARRKLMDQIAKRQAEAAAKAKAEQDAAKGTRN